MQPQSPGGPNSQFDFIMNDGGKKRRSLPQLTLSKPVAAAIAIVLAIIFLVIFSSVIGGSKNKNTQPVVNIMAEAQEISRVSDLVNQETKDPDATALAATVSATLSSQKSQFGSYLASTGYKVNAKALVADKNPSIDTQFQTAAQNNNLPSVYNNYLKQGLAAYLNSMANEYKSTQSAKLKSILNNAASSVNTLLSSLN